MILKALLKKEMRLRMLDKDKTTLQKDLEEIKNLLELLVSKI